MRTILSVTAASLLLLFFILAPALAQEGPDEVESNDTKSLADSIDGYVIEGEIGRRGDDDDWFVLEGQEGFNPTFTIYYDDDECDIDFEVFSGRNSVGSATAVGSPDSLTCEVPGECYIHVYIFDGHGEYTIEIEPGRRDRDRDRRRARDCEGPDEVEPNDEEDLADYIDGYEIEGYACEGDIDWFVLGGQEGTRPEITLYYDDDECDIDLDVWSDDDQVGSLTGVSSPDGDDFRVPGGCWIMVYSYDGEGEYYIEIEPGGDRPRRFRDCEGPDEVESNDEEDLADYIDSLAIEGYACDDDVDWFVLGGQEGYNPVITLHYDDDECDIDLEVWSDDELVGTLTSTSSPDGDDFDIPGECWIMVHSFSGEGWYEIEIEPEGDRPRRHRDRDCEGPDEVEPNDEEDLADYIDGYFIEGYACEGDVDWFILGGQEGRHPTIRLYYDDDECDIDLDVWSDDDLVGSLTSVSSPDSDDFRVPGECWIMVYSFSGEGWYEIEIE